MRARGDQLATWRTLQGRIRMLRRFGWQWSDPGTVNDVAELRSTDAEADKAKQVCQEILGRELGGAHKGTTVAAARKTLASLEGLQFS